MSEYPEHDKIRELKGANMTAGEFLDWLRDEKNYSICEYVDRRKDLETDSWFSPGYCPVYTSTEKLLYEFFGIDPDKIEDEKLRMLEECRRAVEKGEAGLIEELGKAEEDEGTREDQE